MKIYFNKGKEMYDLNEFKPIYIGRHRFADKIKVNIEDDNKAALLSLGINLDRVDDDGMLDLGVAKVEVEDDYITIDPEIEENIWMKYPKPIENNIPNEDLENMGYPKKRKDLSEIILDSEGNPGHYFSIENTAREYGFEWIFKLMSIDILDSFLFNKPFLLKKVNKHRNKVEQYNSASSNYQYKIDVIDRRRFSFYKYATIMATVIVSFLMVLPGVSNNIAIKALDKENYKKAEIFYKLSYTKSGFKERSNFAKALGLSKDKKYDDAIDVMSTLIPYQNKTGLSISRGLNHIKYNQAIDAYYEKDYKKSMDIFENIELYENSNEYYLKSGYALGEKLYEDGDIVGAIGSFHKVRGYKDALERSLDLSEQVYRSALDLYENGKYDDAREELLKISSFNYKDSGDMANQSLYAKGVKELNNSNYSAAEEIFKDIYKFKDSSAILSEIIYLKANNNIDKNKPMAVLGFSSIKGHRDAMSKLTKKGLPLYGKFIISEKDGLRMSGVEITFDENNILTANTMIDGFAISTSDVKRPYEFKDGIFVSGDYSIEVKSSDYSYITVVVRYKDEAIEYKGVRVAELSDIYSVEESKGMSDKEKALLIFKDRLNKYTDFKINVDGNMIDVDMLNDYIQGGVVGKDIAPSVEDIEEEEGDL